MGRHFMVMVVAPGWMSDVPKPSEVELRDDGSAVAWFEGSPLVAYETLEALLARHGLAENDLVDAPARSTTRPRRS
jgi:hypothetical protein